MTDTWTDGIRAPKTWQDRFKNYEGETGYPQVHTVDEEGRAYAFWIMGNDYRVKSKYHGGYPATYLKRIKGLFPEKQRVLHLFSGKVDTDIIPGDTVDINPSLAPTFVDDAHTLRTVPLAEYDLVLADPPYTAEDADHYGTCTVTRSGVMRTLGARCAPGTHVVFLDQMLPMYRKVDWCVEAHISLVKSTNHRFRVATIFCRCDDKPALGAQQKGDI